VLHNSQHIGTYLLFSFLGDDPEPVSYHAEHSGKVRQAHQNPEQNHRLVVVKKLWILQPTCRTKDTTSLLHNPSVTCVTETNPPEGKNKNKQACLKSDEA